MENSLAIIITGYLRNFFNNDNFTNMYNRSKESYTNILVICVLNSNNFVEDQNKLQIYFDTILHCNNVICNYCDHINDYNTCVADKINNYNYNIQKTKYFSSYKDAHQSIYDPDSYIASTVCVQQYQIKLGIQLLLKYMVDNTCNFKICMRTRFDSNYPENFFPHIPEYDGDVIKHITFDTHVRNLVLNVMEQRNIKNIEELITHNKNNRLILHSSHVNDITNNILGFGGLVCHNYGALENIKNNGFNDTMYSFNDFYYFSKTHNFIKLINWIDNSCITECNNSDLYNHYFCAESQLMIFCLNNDINILMYPESHYGINAFVNRS